MSPFLYDPAPYNAIHTTPSDIAWAIIPIIFIIISIVATLRFILYRERKIEEINKTNKKKTLKSLIIMKDLEDELEKEMSEAIIARAIRSRPS